MDVEKVKNQKRGVASDCGDPVLQWGKSKRLRGGKKESSPASHASGVLRKPSKTENQGSQIRKRALKLRKQAPGGKKSCLSEALARDKKLIKRYNSCVSSAVESKSIAKHRSSASSKSLLKLKADRRQLEKFDKKISPTQDKDMVVARRGLEAGIHIGTFQNEMQNLEVYLMPKFMIALSHKEKEEDFMAIKGSKLPIRPKRRAKHIQKALHFVSPGTWLCELSLDRYEVREKKNVKKKSWGLKAMTSADSESVKS